MKNTSFMHQEMTIRLRKVLPSFQQICLLLLITYTGASFDPNAITFDCPATLNTPTLLTGVDVSDNTPILLPIASTNKLCTLSRVKDGIYIPYGRSYDGKDWERPAGKMERLSIYCGQINSNQKCQITISKPADSNDAYYLTSYESTHTIEQQVSRFLERATFGPRRVDLSSWDTAIGIKDAMANWVKDQTTNKAITSHREYFRKRLSPRVMETYKIGAPGPKACEKNSRWRRFAFTNLDRYMSYEVNKFTLEIQSVTVNGVTTYVLSFAGQVRTVINSPLVIAREGTQLDMTGATKYKICYAPDLVGDPRTNPYSDAFRLVIGTTCKDIEGGNPEVNINPTYLSTLPSWSDIESRTIDFSTFDNTKLTEIDVDRTQGSRLLLLQSVTDSKCDTFPNPIDNSYLSTPPSRENPDPPVYAKLPGGKYAIHDYRYQAFENTVENPKSDGGGNMVVEAANGGDSQVMLCANARRSIFNEDSCKISHEANTCVVYNEAISTITSRQGSRLVCGSIGEVAPDPMNDNYFDHLNFHADEMEYRSSHKRVWNQVALFSEDQLRQRVAWAFSQIMAIPHGTLHGSQNAEGNSMYYDIFVRHAFNNYLDVLRGVSFHPKMAETLTFTHNASLRRIWDMRGIKQSPDENYAREIMQLYTIGLVKLNMDGTSQLDQWGREINTYDTSDILTFARAWTGFFYSLRRSNMQDIDHSGHSRVDFMTIHPDDEGRRDWNPKRSLTGGYIGDRYPLCVDMPEQSFLRIGAKFNFLGNTSSPELQTDESDWENDHSFKKFILSTSSPLYEKLCNDVDNDSTCDYQVSVALDTNLPCYGDECKLSTVRVIQVSEGVYYEYVRQPCVQLAFYEGGKKVANNWNLNYAMCANPKLPIATELCCAVQGYPNHVAGRPCQYVGERMTFDTNIGRCTDNGGFACDPAFFRPNENNCPDDKCCRFFRSYRPRPERNPFHWTTSDCTLKILVDADGTVAVIHEPVLTTSNQRTTQYIVPHASNETVSFFHIVWQDGEFDPTLPKVYPHVGDNSCFEGSCQQTTNDMCLCDVIVSETIAFTSTPTKEDVLSTLSIGSFGPDMLMGYNLMVDSGDVKVHTKNPPNFEIDTIFEVTDEYGDTIYLKNMVSNINVGGQIDLKNPIHFNDMVDPEIRDVYYETEAVLKHYLHHPNTPPFVAKSLIKRFGTSNPSPRYVEAVARAFQSGYYQWPTDGQASVTFGDNKWGNLESTIAAIILDSEVTSPVLDYDPAYGTLREPLLKVMGFMRSMEYTRTNHDDNIDGMFLNGIQDRIGQMAYESPDQFSFFSPFNSPGGQFAASELATPEAEALSMSQTIMILNGLFSLVRNGLCACDWGFGQTNRQKYNGGHCRGFDGLIATGDFSRSTGYLAYSPSVGNNATAGDVIDELSTLLTSGRLSAENKLLISDAYTNAKNLHDQEMAVRVAQQLIVTTPEFHSTSHYRTNSLPRQASPENKPNTEPYKAVVMVYLFGGLDSFNVLVPNPECNLYNEYTSERGSEVSLGHTELLEIDATGSGQSCQKFSVNKQFSALKQIYDDGKGIFLANTGHLSKPVSKENYREETKTQLFSHNIMEKELNRVDAFNEHTGTGVLGRMLDKLGANGYGITPIGIGGNSVALAGDPTTPRPIDVIPGGGLVDLYTNHLASNIGKTYMKNIMRTLNGDGTLNNGLFGDYWSQAFIDNWNRTDFYRSLISGATLSTTFQNTNIGRNLQMTAKLIKVHSERQRNRDVFYMKIGGFDHHFQSKLSAGYSFPPLNAAIQSFYNELVDQGNLDKVTFILTSEFGRTINPNTGGGTDHAWGGNYFLFGGEVNGGRILGNYPSSLHSSHYTNIGRGRLIPTTSWDSVFNGIANWFGITDEDELQYTIPNRNNHGCRLYTDKDLYTTGTQSLVGCAGGSLTFSQDIQMAERRFLTGEEQKQFCEIFGGIASDATNEGASRCVVIDQRIVEASISGEPSRMLEAGSFTLTIEYEISTDQEDFGEAVIAQTNNNLASIQADLTAIVPNATTISVVKTTNSDPVFQPVGPPTLKPSVFPTKIPSIESRLTEVPSENPSMTSKPSSVPSLTPSSKPSRIPSDIPSDEPNMIPSSKPSWIPSDIPSDEPSMIPSFKPSWIPSDEPSVIPSFKPSWIPSDIPSDEPSMISSSKPSWIPSNIPSASNIPSEEASLLPSLVPSQLTNKEKSRKKDKKKKTSNKNKTKKPSKTKQTKNLD